MSVHTATNVIRHHSARLDEHGEFALADELIPTTGEPDHEADTLDPRRARFSEDPTD